MSTTFTEADEWRMSNPKRRDADTEAMREAAQRELSDKDLDDLAESLDEAFATTLNEQRAGHDGLSPFYASHGRRTRH